MRLHSRSRPGRVVALDSMEDGSVLLDEGGGSPSALPRPELELVPRGLAHDLDDTLDENQENGVMRGGGKRNVEAEIGLLGVAIALEDQRVLMDDLPQAIDVTVVPGDGSQLGAHGLERSPGHDDIQGAVVAGEGGVRSEHRRLRKASICDVRAASDTDIDHTRVLEHPYRLAHGAAAHSQSGGENPLGRQRFSRRKGTRANSFDNLIDNG